jgi:hypothetical protein
MNASSFPALLQRFFTERLVTQQGASLHTVAGYRDTFRLLFRFAKARLGREPSALRLEELDPAFLEAFLGHLERDRGNRPRTRNHRLSALHAFFRYVALAEPAVRLQCQRTLAIPMKRFERGPVEFLTEDEATALVSAPTAATWIGRRDRALLLLAVQTGLRNSEITSLRQGRVTRVTPGHVHCASGEPVAADFVVWATGASAPAWIGESGLPCDDRGFVAVNDYLQSTSHPSVFAAGDVATMITRPLPKAGVFAVRQGPLLAENLRRFLGGDALRTYRPQRRFLSLISTGGRHAVASYAGLSWQGRWVWTWKDRIDKRSMRKYDGVPWPVDAGDAYVRR